MADQIVILENICIKAAEAMEVGQSSAEEGLLDQFPSGIPPASLDASAQDAIIDTFQQEPQEEVISQEELREIFDPEFDDEVIIIDSQESSVLEEEPARLPSPRPSTSRAVEEAPKKNLGELLKTKTTTRWVEGAVKKNMSVARGKKRTPPPITPTRREEDDDDDDDFQPPGPPPLKRLSESAKIILKCRGDLENRLKKLENLELQVETDHSEVEQCIKEQEEKLKKLKKQFKELEEKKDSIKEEILFINSEIKKF